MMAASGFHPPGTASASTFRRLGTEGLQRLALTSDSPFVIRRQDDGRRGTQADDRVSRDRSADAAPIETEDSKGAEKERDPMQSNAQQANQARAVHRLQTPSIGCPFPVALSFFG
jgi:hypothetical protein